MVADISYFRAIHGALNSKSAQDTLRRDVRRARTKDYAGSIGYIPDATRNGVIQPIVATTTDAPNKYNILAMPGDQLSVGDILEFYGEHWIVVDIKSVDVVNLIGVAMQCNHLFRWQNFTPDIVERWGVLDSGVYSTTLKSGNQLTVTDKQYKIYLPFDDDTEKLYIDKRIATEIAYDKHGDKILVVYELTGRDSISESYGEGGHLLVMNARSSSDYNPLVDNIDLMICDYIDPNNFNINPAPSPLSCSIDGRDTIRAGAGYRDYRAVFYSNDCRTPITGVSAVWGVDVPVGHEEDVDWYADGDVLNISAPIGMEGETLVIYLSDENEEYQPCVLPVEVISLI